MTVLVTAATGTVGRHVPGELPDSATVRVASRDPDRAREAVTADEYVRLDFSTPGTFADALSGVEAVFLVRPPALGARAMAPFVDACDRAGVDRVVYLSAIGAERNPLIPHHRIERRVDAADLAHTHLRASFFAQNLATVHGHEVREHAELLVPAGRGATSFVDARDVAAVAAAALLDLGHPEAYDLTGPEALDYHEVATLLTDVLGRPITYPEPSVLEFVSQRRTRGDPWPFVLLMVGLYTTVRLGLGDRLTDDVERVLGRPPQSLREYLEDHVEAFRRPRVTTRDRR